MTWECRCRCGNTVFADGRLEVHTSVEEKTNHLKEDIDE